MPAKYMCNNVVGISARQQRYDVVLVDTAGRMPRQRTTHEISC